MRAVVYRETGPPSVLSVTERDLPEPEWGEVRVRVMRAGVNPTDWKFRAGKMPGGMPHPEITPGQDGAGVVDAVGDGVKRYAVGDRVWLRMAQHGRPYGSAAEYTVQPETNLVTLPEEASYDVGASLGVPAVTAHRALTSSEFGPLQLGPGTMRQMTVLVAGGAGAVGNAAIQLALWSGARVLTTVSSPEKAALARAAGADEVIDYTTGGTAAKILDLAPDGVDLVVEVAPAVNNDLDREVVKDQGTIAIYANNGGDELALPLRETFSKNLRYQFILLYRVAPEMLDTAAEDITAAVAAGALRVGEEAGVPLHHFPLEQAAEAHQAVEDGTVGKVLLAVAD